MSRTDPFAEFQTPADPFAEFQTPAKAAPEAPSIAGFGRNVLTSGGQFLGDTASMLVHPIQTVEGIGESAVGLISKMTPARFKVAGNLPEEDLVDAITQHYKTKYGSVDAAKKAVYEDPVGVAADLSTLATGVEGFARLGTTIPRVAATAGRVAETAGTVARVADPLQAVTRPVGAIAKKMGIPEKLYASALKAAPRSNTPEEVAAMVKTGIDKRIPISEGGIEKLHGLLNKFQETVASDIASKPGATVDPKNVARRMGGTEDYFAQRVNPDADLAAIQKAQGEYLTKHSVTEKVRVGTNRVPVTGANGKPLLAADGTVITREEPVFADRQRITPYSAAEAQGEKQVTGTELSKSYGELSSAQKSAQKALVRGLKEELEAQFPELKNLNTEQAKLYNLETELEAAVNRMRNREPFGLIPAVVAGGAAAAGGTNAALAAGLLSAVVSSPNVRSRLAFAVDAVQKAKGVPSSRITALGRIDKYLAELSQGIK